MNNCIIKNLINCKIKSIYSMNIELCQILWNLQSWMSCARRYSRIYTNHEELREVFALKNN